GAAAVPRQWPWQVSLRDRGQHVCGGSLIGHQWVLTAAHCVSSSASLQDLRVQLGEAALYSRPRDAISVAAVRAIQHPSFTGDALQGADVALVKLARPVPFSSTIRPIALAPPGSDFPAGSPCWVTGWGDVQQDVALPEPHRLQEADVRVVDLDSCRRLYYPEPITKNMLCAGGVQGQKGFCEGDSRGPLVCQLRDRRWVQAAVVSFSRGCAEPGLPGVYARVSAYRAWIQHHLLPPGHFRRNFRGGRPLPSHLRSSTCLPHARAPLLPSVPLALPLALKHHRPPRSVLPVPTRPRAASRPPEPKSRLSRTERSGREAGSLPGTVEGWKHEGGVGRPGAATARARGINAWL
ncbi:unnamed protein product, partial [Gulo gulo]